MFNIIRALIVLALCLCGMSAKAVEYTARPGDNATRLAEATGQSLEQFIAANKGRIKAPLFWLYTDRKYEVISLPAAPPKVAAREDLVLTPSRTVLTARAAKEEAKDHTLREAIAITQQVVAASSVSLSQPQKPAATPVTTTAVRHSVAAHKRATRPVRNVPVVSEVVPDFGVPCTGCTLESFLAKTEFPTDVARALSDKVADGEFAATVISTGEQFELMQFAGDTLWQWVTATWRSGQREARAREYVVRAHGMVYTIVFWSDTGNWSSRTSTPDPLVLLAIKQSLEDIIRPKCVLEQLPASTCDVTPLAYLVWRTKYRSNATVAVMEGSVYTELADFINNLAVPGVQQEQQEVATSFSFNLK